MYSTAIKLLKNLRARFSVVAKRRIAMVLLGVLIAIPIFSYFFLVLAFSENIPFVDDFEIFLGFLQQLLSSPKLSDRFELLFSAHNQHRIVLSRLFVLAYFTLAHEVNFRALILIGNISLLLTLYLLYLSIQARSPNLRRYFILPVAYLIFQPTFFEASTWASAAIPNLWVITFALCAIRLHQTKQDRSRALIFLFAVFATFTQGNGLLVFTVLAMLSLLGKQKVEAAFWSLNFFLFLWLHLDLIPGPSANFIWSQVVISRMDYALSLIGSAFAQGSHANALVSGCLIVISFGLLTVSRYWEKSPILYGVLSFLLLSALANSMARVGLGVDFALTQSRYKIVSVLCFVLIYLMVIQYLAIGKVALRLCFSMSVCAMSMCIWSYRNNWEQLELRSELLRDSILQWQLERSGLVHIASAKAATIMEQAQATGLYRGDIIYDSRLKSEKIPGDALQFEKVYLGSVLSKPDSTERFFLIEAIAGEELESRKEGIVSFDFEGHRYHTRALFRATLDYAYLVKTGQLRRRTLRALVAEEPLNFRLRVARNSLMPSDRDTGPTS